MNAALLTLYMGQRMGDIIQIKLQNIVTIADNIAVTFKEFKTAGKKGPYTLMVKACSRAGAILLNIGRQAKTDSRSTGRIFFEHSEETFKKQLGNVDVRALRRTGLIRLALTQASQEELLQVSRHSSVEMLNLYLHNGQRRCSCHALASSARSAHARNERTRFISWAKRQLASPRQKCRTH